MKICSKCNEEYDDDYMFCNKCGSQLNVETKKCYCQYCGNFIDEDSDFCPFCGKTLNQKASLQKSVSGESSTISSGSGSLPNSSSYRSGSVNSKVRTAVSDSKEPFFSKHHLFSYDGRRGRLEYIKVGVFWYLLLGIPNLLLTFFAVAIADYNAFIAVIFWIIFFLVFSYPLICNMAKRIHDLGYPTSWAVVYYFVFSFLIVGAEFVKPILKYVGWSALGWLMLLMIMIIITFITIPSLVLSFKKGTDGPNQYGEDPTKE